jgi:hypothetical protein
MASFNSYARLTGDGYVRYIDYNREQIYDGNAAAMAAYASVTYANSAVAVTYNSTHGFVPVTVPAAVLAVPGEYDVLLYNVAKASAAVGDMIMEHIKLKVESGGLRTDLVAL